MSAPGPRPPTRFTDVLELVLFSLPTLAYVLVQSRGNDRRVSDALTRVGLAWGSASAFGWALVLLPPLLLTGWLAIALVPDEVLSTPGVAVAQVTSVGVAINVALRAFGEEVFFRGLLGGVLMRRLGFQRGNLLQAVLFLVPHLALLAVDVRLWPLLPVQFAAGWLLGWLRHRAGTLVPGAVVHVLANLAAGLLSL